MLDVAPASSGTRCARVRPATDVPAAEQMLRTHLHSRRPGAGRAEAAVRGYSEGNFIEAEPDTLLLQIGESKIREAGIDRVAPRSTGILEANQCTIGVVRLDMRRTFRGCPSTGHL